VIGALVGLHGDDDLAASAAGFQRPHGLGEVAASSGQASRFLWSCRRPHSGVWSGSLSVTVGLLSLLGCQNGLLPGGGCIPDQVQQLHESRGLYAGS
jgi:hypothetical protein